MGRPKSGKEIPCETCGKLRYFKNKQLQINKHFYCSEECVIRTPWNKGLTKESDERLKKISEKSRIQMNNEYANGTRDKNKIIEKAHKAVKAKSLKRFKESPRKFISKRGYMIIYIPMVGEKTYHTYIWEKQFGKIPKGYILHHINLDKLDNQIENLQLMPASEHSKLHNKLRKRDSLGHYKAKQAKN